MSGLSFFPAEIKRPSFFQSSYISLSVLTYLSQFLPKASATPTEFYISGPDGIKYALRSTNALFNRNFTSHLNNELPCEATDLTIDIRTQVGSFNCDMWEGVPMSIEFDAMKGYGREGFEFRQCFLEFAKNICENTPKIPKPYGASATNPTEQDSIISQNTLILTALLIGLIIFAISVYFIWREIAIHNNRINQMNRATLLPTEANPVHERCIIVEQRLEEIKQLLKDSKLILPEFQIELTQFEIQLLTFTEKYKCPISHVLMNKPTSIKSGLTFERIQIINYLRTGGTKCPCSDVPIESIANLPSINLLIKDTIDTGLKELENKIKLLHQKMIDLQTSANLEQSSESKQRAGESRPHINRPRMMS